MMTAAAMLSRKGRRRSVRDNDDGEEEGVEVDDSDETVVASGVAAGERVGSRSP
jgi:hypothetical protein